MSTTPWRIPASEMLNMPGELSTLQIPLPAWLPATMHQSAQIRDVPYR
jgi:hypothetical protein